MDKIIVPLCVASLPTFVVCSSQGCQERPFMCARQGCRCQLAHQKCQKPIHWKEMFEAIRNRGYGTPELRAYFETLLALMTRIIGDLTKEKDRLILYSLSIGLQQSQKDLANALLSAKFDNITPNILSSSVEELKLPTPQITKPKQEVSQGIQNINQHADKLMAAIREMCTVKLEKSQIPTEPPRIPTVTGQGGNFISTMPRVNTTPPNLVPGNNPPTYPINPIINNNFRFQPPSQQVPQQPKPPVFPTTLPSSSPGSVSISGALKQLKIGRQEPQHLTSSTPVNPDTPPINTNLPPQPQPQPLPPTPTINPQNVPPLTNASQQESKLRKFLLSQTAEMEVQSKKQDLSDPNYELSKITYLRLKGCSFIEAKLLSKLCPNITKLSLYNCHVSKEGAAAIASSLSKLLYLDLTGNNIGDAGLLAVANGIPNVEILGLTGNEITDEGANIIAQKLQNLVELRLAYNKVTQKGAIKIAESCQKLKGLDINNSKFSQQGKEAIRQLLPKRHLSL